MSGFLNKGLYKEGIRQSRIVGIIFTVINLVYGIMTPINAWSTTSYYQGKSIISGMSFNYLFIFNFVLMAPFLALSLFSFLNKRSTSDFYHSLPHKREAVFTTFFLSGVTWMLISILLPSVVEVVISLFLSKYIELSFLSIANYLLSIFICALLVFSATVLAMTLTGTFFSNIVTALLILFMPRIIILSFISCVKSVSLIATSNSFGIFGNPRYNMIFNFGYSMLYGSFDDSVPQGYQYAIYSVVLALIYAVLAMVVFKRRRSEQAGYSAQNKWIQAAVRISISFLISIIACSLIIQNDVRTSANMTVGIIIIYIFAAIAYFVYEIVSTKGFKTVGKASAGLIVVLALNIIFIGGAKFSRHVILSADFDANQMSYIQFEDNDEYYAYSNEGTLEKYKLREIMLDDPAILEIIASRLNAQNKNVKELKSTGGYINWDYSYSNVFKIKMKNGKTYYRNVYLTSSEMKSFISAFEATDIYSQDLWQLPDNYSGLTIYGDGVLMTNISEEDAAVIYESLKNEIKEKNLLPNDYIFGNVLSNYTSEYLGVGGFSYAGIYVSGIYKNYTYLSDYIISDKTPDTFNLLYNTYVNNEENSSRILNVIDELLSLSKEEISNLDYYSNFTITKITKLNEDESYYSEYYGADFNSEVYDQNQELLSILRDEIEAQSKHNIDFYSSAYSISIYYNNTEYAYLVNLSPESVEKIQEISEELSSVSEELHVY